MKKKVVACLVIAQLGGAPLARAVETPAADAPLAQVLTGHAKEAFEAAQLLVERADFASAYTKFAQAYDLSGDARLLFNMALCESRLRDYARMKQLLGRYQREAGATLSDEDKERIAGAVSHIETVVGRVDLVVNEAGAAVLVDGELAGTTPLAEPLILNMGDHTLSVRKRGFQPLTRALSIAGGSASRMAVQLLPSTRSGRLVVTTDDAAAIDVDGQLVGSGHFEGPFSAGAHELQISEPGKVSYRAQVEVHDGETRTLLMTLVDKEHRAPAVWPWLATGGVVAAGAVVAGFLLLKSPDKTAAGGGNAFPTIQLQ
jgi:hypothetical protein